MYNVIHFNLKDIQYPSICRMVICGKVDEGMGKNTWCFCTI